jgi:hypothetical protein
MSKTPEQKARDASSQAARRRLKNPNLPPYTPGVNPSREPRQYAPATEGQVLGTMTDVTPAIKAVIAPGQELKAQTVRLDDTGAIDHQYVKTQAERGEPLYMPVPPAHAVTKTTTHLGPNGRVDHQYITAKPGEAERFEAYKQALRDEMEQYRGAALAIDYPAPENTWADYLSCYWLGDPHIGMLAHASETLGWHFDLRIAEAELVECFRQLVARTPPSKVCRIVNLGDFYHAETNMQVTPGHGHKLDVDGRAYKVQKVGKRILRSLVDLAKQRHEIVEFVALPGNHDPNMAWSIADWLSAIYEGDERVKVDESIAAYNYREFGTTLIGACHGDGAGEKDLPLLLATRKREAWGRTTRHEMHRGHIHHTRLIEFSGCRVWSHNTLAEKDAWSALKGFDSEQFLESTTYHERFGRESSATVSIERVRAALQAMGTMDQKGRIIT